MSACNVQPPVNMYGSRATTLRADKAYIDLLEAESTWPYKYVVSRTNPVAPRAYPMWGLWNQGVNTADVKTYNDLLPTNYRMQVRASQNKPQTELFGTAPYTALGRGLLRFTDTSSLLQQSNWVSGRGSRIAGELPWDRLQFVDIPEDLKAQRVEMRYGQTTRIGPAYMRPQLQPHDRLAPWERKPW